MQSLRQEPTPIRARRKAGIWLAWAIALGFHAVVLVLPMGTERSVPENVGALIELQLTSFKTTPVPTIAEQIPETPPPELLPALPEPAPIITPEPAYSVIDEQPEAIPEKIEPPLLTLMPQAPDMQRDLQNMSYTERSQLTSAVLMRQFITEESEADRIFGRQIAPGNTEGQKEFFYPVRQNMISMLDQPMPDMPFAYQEGLIYFAYDPGVKGGLQRFWDVITPEFGWRTKYGTEVKCKWILVIAACGWK